MIPLKRLFMVVMGLACMLSIVAYLITTSSAAHAAPAISSHSVSSSSVSQAVAPNAAAALMIQVTQATVNGQSVAILTDVAGMTLYTDSNDTATTVACTGACAQTWPPLLEPAGITLPSATAQTNGLTVVAGGNGNQVEYNGHPLYTYVNDTAAGQVNGEGAGGVWFVAAP